MQEKTAAIHVKVPMEVHLMFKELLQHHRLSGPQVIERLIVKAHQSINTEVPLHERTL